MNSEVKYRADIDGLRAIAVICVVFYHAFPSILPGGFIGVDIFFVISGYLISSIIFKQLSEQRFSIKEFYIKRINRIFPALLILLATSYLVGWMALFTNEFQSLGKHTASGAIFLSNFILYNETGYFDSVSELKPLLHLWSLSIEEQFYLLWPLILFILNKVRFNLFNFILIFFIFSFILNLTQITNNSPSTFYLLPTRIWELLMGCLLAHQNFFSSLNKITSSLKYSIKALKESIALTGCVLILISVFYFDKNQAYPGFRAILPTIGTLFLISAGANTWINSQILSMRPMVWIGLISYPLYLWHWPILSFLRIVNSSELSPISIRLVALTISFLLSWTTFVFLEKPIISKKRSVHLAVMLAILMSIIGTIGFITFKLPPKRIGSRIIIIENQRYQIQSPSRRDETCPKEKIFNELEHCLLSKKDFAPSVVMIGDSHAEVLYQGLERFYKQINENLLSIGGGGCLPFYGVGSFQNGNVDTCSNKIDRLLDYAISSKTINTIILGSRGPLYLTGKGFSIDESSDEIQHNRMIISTIRPHLNNFEEIFKVAMDDTLRKLTKSNKRIIFIIDAPELGFNTLTCLEPRLFSTAQKRAICATSKESFLKRNTKYHSIISSVLKSYPNVIVFDQSKYLCDTKNCYAMKDGKLLYRDDDHLSIYGSKYLAEKFFKEFY